MAVELDSLQAQYRVSFVVSAGNYEQPPLLAYPRTGAHIDAGRITSPADSVLAVTVGSVAHAAHGPKDPKVGEPAAYSRHGPGANYVIKPDLVHYGGSCSLDGAAQAGVTSFGATGLDEAIGTSFATPLVSRLLANIYHQVTPNPSPELARAILTHHARDPRTSGRVQDADEDVVGFGLPAVTPVSLECSPWQSTLVFEDQLRPGYYLEWDDFPYPACLRAGDKYFGEVWMTVAFTPARGAAWGTEYCETHIDAHLGVYQDKRSRATGQVSEKFVGLVPPEHKNPGLLYESYQVAKLRKWSPTRTYHGDLGSTGVRGKKWRLKVQLLSRHGVDKRTVSAQPFALIIAIADPARRAPVYDDMAVSIRSRFQVQNLQVRPQVRIRGTR